MRTAETTARREALHALVLRELVLAEENATAGNTFTDTTAALADAQRYWERYRASIAKEDPDALAALDQCLAGLREGRKAAPTCARCQAQPTLSELADGVIDDPALCGPCGELQAEEEEAAEKQAADDRADAVEVAIEAADRGTDPTTGLPALEGSDKQISWAADIRARTVRNIAHELAAERDAGIDPDEPGGPFGAFPGRSRWGAEHWDEIEGAFASLCAITRAGWWIDARDDGPGALLERAMGGGIRGRK